MATDIIAVLGFFLTMIVLIISYFRTRHLERMALIQSDKTTNIFEIKNSDSNSALKFGLLLLSVGLGLLVGLLIDNYYGSEPAGVFICILIFGGLSLILYHFYISRKNDSHRDQDDKLV